MTLTTSCGSSGTKLVSISSTPTPAGGANNETVQSLGMVPGNDYKRNKQAQRAFERFRSRWNTDSKPTGKLEPVLRNNEQLRSVNTGGHLRPGLAASGQAYRTFYDPKNKKTCTLRPRQEGQACLSP